MRRKSYYIIFLVLLLLALLVPAIYSNKADRGNDTPATAGLDTAASGNSAADADGNVNSVQGGIPVQPASPTESITGEPAGKEEADKSPNGFSPVSEENSSPDLSSGKAVTVNVAVLGKNEELLFGPAGVTITKKDDGGATALDTLDATGLPYHLSTNWTGFVEEVAGQSNKGQAGWMFKVNGEVPLVACDKKTVANDDQIIWWYSRSMDIPPPEWDDLLKR